MLYHYQSTYVDCIVQPSSYHRRLVKHLNCQQLIPQFLVIAVKTAVMAITTQLHIYIVMQQIANDNWPLVIGHKSLDTITQSSIPCYVNLQLARYHYKVDTYMKIIQIFNLHFQLNQQFVHYALQLTLQNSKHSQLCSVVIM